MKKIKSEIKINDDKLFKVKIGTTNKKHPDIIYVEIGTYISPNEEKKSYKNDICSLDTEMRKYLENKLRLNDYLQDSYILVNDCPYERMETGKKSYFEMQLFVKPQKKLFEIGRFSDIALKINELLVSDVKEEIEKCFQIRGFDIHKTRK